MTKESRLRKISASSNTCITVPLNETALAVLQILAEIQNSNSNIDPLIIYLNSVTELDLSEAELSTQDIENLCEALKANKTEIRLNLSANNLSSEHDKPIIELLTVNKTLTLKNLIFWDHTIILSSAVNHYSLLAAYRLSLSPENTSKTSNSLLWSYSKYIFGTAALAVGAGIYITNRYMRQR